jgi:hypothetical protein
MRPAALILVIQAGDLPQISANCVVVSIGASPATARIRSSANRRISSSSLTKSTCCTVGLLQMKTTKYALSWPLEKARQT